MLNTRKNRIKQGLCRDCGKEKIDKESKSRCRACLDKINTARKSTVKKYKSAGLCIRCGNLPKQTSQLCQRCTLKAVQFSRDRVKSRKDSGNCTRCGIRKPELNKTKCQPCLIQCRKIEIKTRLEKKSLVHKAYGNKCNCCGLVGQEFLTIDHISGDGGKYRKSGLHKGGTKFYRWIIENNFPDILQLLCWNCNLGKYHSGQNVCPHKLRDKNVA